MGRHRHRHRKDNAATVRWADRFAEKTLDQPDITPDHKRRMVFMLAIHARENLPYILEQSEHGERLKEIAAEGFQYFFDGAYSTLSEEGQWHATNWAEQNIAGRYDGTFDFAAYVADRDERRAAAKAKAAEGRQQQKTKTKAKAKPKGKHHEHHEHAEGKQTRGERAKVFVHDLQAIPSNPTGTKADCERLFALIDVLQDTPMRSVKALRKLTPAKDDLQKLTRLGSVVMTNMASHCEAECLKYRTPQVIRIQRLAAALIEGPLRKSEDSARQPEPAPAAPAAPSAGRPRRPRQPHREARW